MFDNGCTSPRANIREWLSKTIQSVPAETTQTLAQTHAHHLRREDRVSPHSGHPNRSSHASQLPRVQSTKHHKHHTRDQRRYNGHHSPEERARYGRTSSVVDLHKAEKAGLRSGPKESGIAERLGLQGPFRAFSYEDRLSVETSRPQKHRPGGFLSSPDLQPASATDIERSSKDRVDSKNAQQAKASRYIVAARSSASCSKGTTHSTILFSSPKQVSKSFERRPRHKTREDRYEVKDDSTRTRRPRRSDRERKDTKKPNRKMKLGRNLRHEYTAPNVSKDRLTVRFHSHP